MLTEGAKWRTPSRKPFASFAELDAALTAIEDRGLEQERLSAGRHYAGVPTAEIAVPSLLGQPFASKVARG